MAEILTEKGICDSCGSKVREGSSFCFSCGESLVVEPPPPPIRKPATSSLEAPRNGRSNTSVYSDLEPAPVPAPAFEPIVSAPEPTAVRPTNVTRRLPARNRPPKTVEMEWVRHEPSATWFLVFSLFLALIVAGLVAAAIYLK